jgi:hypothetical protein
MSRMIWPMGTLRYRTRCRIVVVHQSKETTEFFVFSLELVDFFFCKPQLGLYTFKELVFPLS